jgi:hypothetical protein
MKLARPRPRGRPKKKNVNVQLHPPGPIRLSRPSQNRRPGLAASIPRRAT